MLGVRFLMGKTSVSHLERKKTTTLASYRPWSIFTNPKGGLNLLNVGDYGRASRFSGRENSVNASRVFSTY
jgi:hypothetical protein